MYVDHVPSVKMRLPAKQPLPPVVELDYTELIDQLTKINLKLSALADSDISEHVRRLSTLTLMHSQRAAAILSAAVAGDTQKRIGA